MSARALGSVSVADTHTAHKSTAIIPGILAGMTRMDRYVEGASDKIPQLGLFMAGMPMTLQTCAVGRRVGLEVNDRCRDGLAKGCPTSITRKRALTLFVAVVASWALALPPTVTASAVVGPASEWTQLLNNVELIGIAGQSAEQVQNQLTQIGQLAQQIQNQIQIYENMLQNTLQLPSHVWGQVETDLAQLQSLMNQGQGIAFSMGNLDDVLKQRFQSFGEFKTGLANGEDFSSSYQQWSDTNRDTIASTLRAAGLTSDQFATEEATMAQLRSMSESSVGQMQALQVAHQIAAQQVEQTQKLRGLVSQQTAMMATWYQSEQAAKDLAQTRREDFFETTPPSSTGGQTMEPRW